MAINAAWHLKFLTGLTLFFVWRYFWSGRDGWQWGWGPWGPSWSWGRGGIFSLVRSASLPSPGGLCPPGLPSWALWHLVVKHIPSSLRPSLPIHPTIVGVSPHTIHPFPKLHEGPQSGLQHLSQQVYLWEDTHLLLNGCWSWRFL